MLQLLRGRSRRRRSLPKRRSARVFDEAAILALTDEAAAAAGNRRPRRGPRVLLAIARAPLAILSFLARTQAAEEAGARGRLQAAELGDLVVGEAMRFAIYL